MDSQLYGYVSFGSFFEMAPTAVAISLDEKWCIAVHGGIVVVQLEPPFAPNWGLDPDRFANAFTRVGRDIPEMWPTWIATVPLEEIDDPGKGLQAL